MTVRSPLSFIPPPFNAFSHSSFFQIEYYPIGRAGHPPSFDQGNKSLPPPSLPVSFMHLMVSFPFFQYSKFSGSIFFSFIVIQSPALAALHQ
jgi:hypothetical protein